MSTQTDYLPWVMGALAAAIAALALVIHEVAHHGAVAASLPTSALQAVPNRPASGGPATMVTTTGVATTGAATTDAATTDAAPAAIAGPVTPLAPPIAPTVVPIPRTDLPPGQVYECAQNGQHIFSDSPCGERPAIRQLSDVNRMAAVATAPDLPRARSAPPPGYPDPGADYGPSGEGPAGEQPAANDATSGVLLYPAPLRPYRYHGQRDQPPRYLPRPAPPRPPSRAPG